MALFDPCLFGFCFCGLKKWPEDSFCGFLQSIICNANVCVELLNAACLAKVFNPPPF